MAHLTNFSFEFFYAIFTKDASLLLLHHGAKKVKNDQQLKSKGPALKWICFQLLYSSWRFVKNTFLQRWRVSPYMHDLLISLATIFLPSISRIIRTLGRFKESVDPVSWSVLSHFLSQGLSCLQVCMQRWQGKQLLSPTLKLPCLFPCSVKLGQHLHSVTTFAFPMTNIVLWIERSLFSAYSF